MLSVHRQRQVAESDLLQHVRRSADQQRIVFGYLSFQQVVHLLDKRLAVIVVFVLFLYAESRSFRLLFLRSVLRHLHHPIVNVFQRRRVLRQPFHLLECPRPAQVFARAPHRVDKILQEVLDLFKQRGLRLVQVHQHVLVLQNGRHGVAHHFFLRQLVQLPVLFFA